jgi:hypothetical protein
MKAALALLLLSGIAAAQPAGSGKVITIPLDDTAPEVSAAASPTEVKLGARFTVFVTALYGDGVTVNLREPIDLGGAFEVRRHVAVDSMRGDGRHEREWQIEVYAWDLGDLAVAPVAVTFISGGHAGQVATNAVPVRVTGVLGDADDPKLMRPDSPPVALFERTWLWKLLHDPIALGIGIAVIVAAFLLARWPRKQRVVPPKRQTVLAPRRRLDMTSERALERLREIERSGALDRDAARKLGYADMADVIREYIGARFAIQAARELTSSELVGELGRAAATRDRDLVAAWLERCDPVKYGGVLATSVGAKALLEDARALVVSVPGGST